MISSFGDFCCFSSSSPAPFKINTLLLPDIHTEIPRRISFGVVTVIIISTILLLPGGVSPAAGAVRGSADVGF